MEVETGGSALGARIERKGVENKGAGFVESRPRSKRRGKSRLEVGDGGIHWCGGLRSNSCVKWRRKQGGGRGAISGKDGGEKQAAHERKKSEISWSFAIGAILEKKGGENKGAGFCWNPALGGKRGRLEVGDESIH